MKSVWCSGNTLGIWPSRPGFKSQVWQNLNAIFQYEIQCFANVQDYHAHSKFTIHASTMIRSMANIPGVAYSKSTHWHMIRKVNESTLVGPEFNNTPPIWPKTPPWVCNFSFYTLFVLFYFSLLLTINLINIFIKKSKEELTLLLLLLISFYFCK